MPPHGKPKVKKSSSVDVDFYFAVGEIRLGADNCTFDQLGNHIPQQPTDGYWCDTTAQQPVFRYRNGTCKPCPEISWFQEVGSSMGLYSGPTPSRLGMITYKTYAVFDCGPFSPALYLPTEVLYEVQKGADGQWKQNISETPPKQNWQPIQEGQFPELSFPTAPIRAVHFDMSPDGLCLAREGGQWKEIDGREASYLGTVVPDAYRGRRNTTNKRASDLGGDLAIIIGLMALADRGVDFSKWRHNEWKIHRHCRASPDQPRGVLVHIAITDLEAYSDMIDLEERGVLVKNV